MKNRINKIWKDPVGSKIIANIIWILLLGLSTLIYLLYQKFNSSISFKQAWNNLVQYLGQERLITNWDILFILLAGIILLVNRRIILKILIQILRSLLGIKKYSFDYHYNFTNQGVRTTGVITSERSFNNFKIKPQGNTKDWSLLVLFSHNYSLLDKEKSATEKIRIYKRYSDNKLYFELFPKRQGKANKTSILIDEYEDQEFELSFILSLEEGGIILTIRRHRKELYKTDVIYGCSYFKIVAEDSIYDFDLQIDYERVE